MLSLVLLSRVDAKDQRAALQRAARPAPAIPSRRETRATDLQSDTERWHRVSKATVSGRGQDRMRRRWSGRLSMGIAFGDG
eukprot:884433-Prymnesium_polylepis.1